MKTTLIYSGNKLVYTTIGFLEGSGSYFWVPLKPSLVIKYTPINSYGVYLVENTTTPTTPGRGEWGYRDNLVYLGDPLSSGEKVLALYGETFLFQDVDTLAGVPYFDVGKTEVEPRRKQQQLRLVWLSPDETLESVTVSFEDLLQNIGSESSHYEVALDLSGPWSSTVSLGSLKDHQEVTFYVRCTKPVNSAIGFFNDVALRVEGFRVSPGVQVAQLSGESALIPLPFDHPYLVPWVLYEGQVRGSFPVIVYDSVQKKAFLLLRWEGAQNVLVHYFVQDVSHRTPTVVDPSGGVLQFAPSSPVMGAVVASSDSVVPQDVLIEPVSGGARYTFRFSSGGSNAQLYLYSLPHFSFIEDELVFYSATLSQQGGYVWLSYIRRPYALVLRPYSPISSHSHFWPCFFGGGAYIFASGSSRAQGQLRYLKED